MKLNELIKLVTVFRAPEHFNFEVKGLCCNSKLAVRDCVFVAIKGPNIDGRKFISQALDNGARAIVSEGNKEPARLRGGVVFIKVKDARMAMAKLAGEFYGWPTKKIKVIGITGTNGKTTITYLLEALLKKAHFQPGVIGTVNHRFKNKVFPSKNTTPGPLELELMFAQMLKNGVTYCAMEVSSHALDQERVTGINFHSAIFTNLTQDHLDYHKSISNYFKSKVKLFRGLSSRAFAVINNDDKFSGKLKGCTRARVVTYGIDKKSDVMAENLTFSPGYTEFTLAYRNIREKVRTSLIGRHNVYNILAVAAWAVKERIDLSLAISVIKNFLFVPGRLEKVICGKDFSVFVDYAHTQDALTNVLTSLRQVSSGRIILVFGCGGDRDKLKRPMMGAAATELSDYAIITSDNPRSEGPLDIIEDIKKGICMDNYCVIPERFAAIRKSLSIARKGDIVLIAGKGHEDYQVIKDKILYFDDREAVRKCLR